MEQRIKAIRTEQGLTQAEFGARIGVKGNTVTGYETGARIPPEVVILSICREFSVSEQWLRTGEGEMYRTLSADEELAAFFGNVLSGEPDFRRRLLAALSRLEPGQWQVLEQITEELQK